MIVWYRNLKVQDRDVEDREYLASMVSSPSTYRFVYGLNIGINITLFFITCYFFQFNPIAHAIAFILLDFVLSVVDYLVFTYFPYNHPANTEVEAAQKRIKKMLRKQAWLKERKDNKPYGGWLYECYSNEYRWLTNSIEMEEVFINQELKKIKEQEVKENTKKSKDYTSKQDYFVALQDKLHYLIQNHDYKFLTPVLENIKSLMNVLNDKPIGYEMIPHKLYLHLDELLLVLEKFAGLDEDLKQEYIKDIEKISVYLSQSVENISDRIKDLETESIEVSIAVLLKELSKEVDKDV